MRIMLTILAVPIIGMTTADSQVVPTLVLAIKITVLPVLVIAMHGILTEIIIVLPAIAMIIAMTIVLPATIAAVTRQEKTLLDRKIAIGIAKQTAVIITVAIVRAISPWKIIGMKMMMNGSRGDSPTKLTSNWA
jgi:hypothetical protein